MPLCADRAPGAQAQKLSETGLWLPGTQTIDPAHYSYSPQYPLWSDGAHKKRWFSLPAGVAIDASNPDQWEFPPGTRLWKEFGFSQPVETRMIQRLPDGSWRYAVYVWREDGSDADLAPAAGIKRHRVADAPGGRYPIPSQDDCRACHEGGPVPVLGLSALQLSPDRDPLAPNAETLREGDMGLAELIASGLLTGLPLTPLEHPPRIQAATPTARAALGYLHANCGHCHNPNGSLELVEMALAQNSSGNPVESLRTLLEIPAQEALGHTTHRVLAGDPDASTLVQRMRTRNPLLQMPPLGTRVPDREALALIEHWIQHDIPNQEEFSQ